MRINYANEYILYAKKCYYVTRRRVALEGDDDFKAGTLEWQADKNLLEEVRPVDGISLNNCSRYLV